MSSICVRRGMLWQQAEQGGPHVFLNIHVLQPLPGIPRRSQVYPWVSSQLKVLRKPLYRCIQEASLSDARTTTTECKCKGAVDV